MRLETAVELNLTQGMYCLMVKRTERKAFDEFTLAIKCPFISTCYPVNVCYFKWVNDK